LALVLADFCLLLVVGIGTEGEGIGSSSLSELTTEPVSTAASVGRTCANLHDAPLRQPAGDAKKAHGGTPPSAPSAAKSLYFFAVGMCVCVCVRGGKETPIKEASGQ
jgi:hypothetical protein